MRTYRRPNLRVYGYSIHGTIATVSMALMATVSMTRWLQYPWHDGYSIQCAMASATNLLARVRPSCAALIGHESSSVRIQADKVRAFVNQLDAQEMAQCAPPLHFPLNFRSQQDKLNFLSTCQRLSMLLPCRRSDNEK